MSCVCFWFNKIFLYFRTHVQGPLPYSCHDLWKSTKSEEITTVLLNLCIVGSKTIWRLASFGGNVNWRRKYTTSNNVLEQRLICLDIYQIFFPEVPTHPCYKIYHVWIELTALTSEPSNVKLHLRRCELLKETGDSRAALRGYQKVHQSKKHSLLSILHWIKVWWWNYDKNYIAITLNL